MKKTVLLLLLSVGSLMTAASATASPATKHYEVVITNLTPGQTFTPILVATHNSDIRFFTAGEPATPALAELAESGSTASLEALLAGVPERVFDTGLTGGLLEPGGTATVFVSARPGYSRLSLAGMLIPTNDTFVALNSVPLPRRSETVIAFAYDAGSEVNDEDCDLIPGPFCMGAGLSDENGEGQVTISNGIHGIGDLDPAVFDWRNPVARVSITRIRRPKHDN